MFNLRVYGLLINEKKQVLVSDEFIRGGYYTKFPGGGLEFGEGTRECLKREFKEELDIEVEVLEHLYTTDFFQMSAFNPEHQIISIYYLVKALEPIPKPMRSGAFQFDEEQLLIYEETGETETFRLIEWDDFSDAAVTLPIDKVVARMIKEKY
ncbi:NUDIX domain-containing protein [Pollutibacter soli]|uniref:NUDIX domain-containing protein n=1 Tax=Pollutibacter soli TaxID=3034157 RepID=UPI003013D59E